MRRWAVGALMMTLLCLAGCQSAGGDDAETLALGIRADWLAMTGCVCHVDLSADYGERVFDCGVDVVYDQVTGGTITVTAPDLVAGVTARFTREGTELSYDGVSLETGPLTDEGLSPLEGPLTLYREVTQGYLGAVDLRDGVLETTYRDYEVNPGEGLECVVTFDAQTRAPLTAALYWDGTQVLEARVDGFQLMTGADAGT